MGATHQPTTAMTISDAQICRDLEWPAGAHLETDDDPRAVQRLRLTAIGEERVLARPLSFNGEPLEGSPEFSPSLTARSWRRV